MPNLSDTVSPPAPKRSHRGLAVGVVAGALGAGGVMIEQADPVWVEGDPPLADRMLVEKACHVEKTGILQGQMVCDPRLLIGDRPDAPPPDGAWVCTEWTPATRKKPATCAVREWVDSDVSAPAVTAPAVPTPGMPAASPVTR